MWGEIPLGKPFGIELRLHFLFFITLLLAALSQAWVSGYAVGWAVVLAGPVLIVTIYLHELGHCLASKAVSPVRRWLRALTFKICIPADGKGSILLQFLHLFHTCMIPVCWSWDN